MTDLPSPIPAVQNTAGFLFITTSPLFPCFVFGLESFFRRYYPFTKRIL
jgi:hypothetical protein